MTAKTFFYAGSLMAMLVACQNSQPNKVAETPAAEISSPTVDAPEMPAPAVDAVPAKKPKPQKNAAVSVEAVVFANAIDEVCGMEVQPDYIDTCHYKGKVYGFCSEYCRDKFKETPLKYLKGQ